MEVRLRRPRCGVEEPISGGRDEEIPGYMGEDITWVEGGDSKAAGRGCEIGDNCGEA